MAKVREHCDEGDVGGIPGEDIGIEEGMLDGDDGGGKVTEKHHSLLRLNDEQVDIRSAGITSQLRRLNRLLKLNTDKERQRNRFNSQMVDLVKLNPTLSRLKLNVDGFEEPLLHQIIWKRPTLKLVELVYSYHPNAGAEVGFGNLNILHNALLSHSSLEIIQFICEQNPNSLQASPYPPLFCALNDETDMQVLDYLVKSYPAALSACDLASVTPMDIALTKQLALPVIQLFFSRYPQPELKVSKRAGSVKMLPEVSAIFALDHPLIRKLDASFMRFTQQGWISFFRLMACNSTLEELLLDLTEAEVDPDVCEALNKMMRENCSMTKLVIQGRLLPTAFANAIIRGLVQHQSLTDIAFLVHIDFMNIEELISNLANHATIKSLTLRHSVAHGTDWSGLASLSQLVRLDLADCRIGPNLATPVAQLLKSSTALEELKLERNFILDEGTITIAESLRHNRVLKELYYSQNGIEEEGWKAFLVLLKNFNTTLRSVQLSQVDEFYDTHNPQLVYYCDQNCLGRKLETNVEDEIEDAFM